MDERLPDGWVWTTLGEISTKPQYGWTTKAKPIGGSVLLLRTTDISSGTIDWDSVPYCTEVPENLADYLLEAGDIVISRAGSVGISYLLGDIPKQTVFASYLIRFRPLQGAEPQYVAYYLQTPEYWNRIYEESSGIALANVNARKLEAIEIPLAPFPEQHRIVAAIEQQFTRLDNAVASLQSAKARSKQYRTSLLKAAVEGELTKEWRSAHPTEETGIQMLARILAERRARWEEEQLAKMRKRGITLQDDRWKQEYKEPQRPNVSGLPALPEGWCWASVEQICDQIADCLHSTPKFKEKGFLCVDTNCIKPGKILLEKARYVDEDTFVERNRRMKPQNGDVIFSREGALLGIAVKISEDLDFCLGQRMMAFRLNQSVNAKFYEIMLNSAVFYAQYRSKITGTASPHLNIEDIKVLAIPLPSLQEQYSIVLEVERNLSVIDAQEEVIESSLKRAEHERQSILREAFAGRLVRQDSEDEPASELLERILEEQRKREEAEKIERVNRKRIKMESTKKRRDVKTNLHKTLVEAKHPLPPDDLFKRAGLKVDEQPESVEAFYEELHADENVLIMEKRPDDAHVLLEALEPSAEVLTRIAEAPIQAQEAEQSQKTIDAPMLWNM